MNASTEPAASPRASRGALLRASRALSDGTEVAEEGIDPISARVVASPALRVDVVRVRAGELRRSEVWISPVGVVALAHQADDEVEGTLVALPPVAAHQVCVSAIALDRGSRGARDPRSAPKGFGALARATLDDAQPDVAVTVVDWRHGDVLTRWVVVDSPEGRVAALDAPAGDDVPLTLQPVGPVVLAAALGDHVARGTVVASA